MSAGAAAAAPASASTAAATNERMPPILAGRVGQVGQVGCFVGHIFT
jgi:hypothetical protein